MSQGTVNGIPLSRSMSSSSTNNFVVLSAKAIYDWAVGLFAPKSNPTFTGNVVLPSTLTIGGITYSSIFYNRKIYNYQNTDSSVTGSTTQTVVANLLVSGGVMDANSKLSISLFASKIGTAGSLTVRGYISTVGTNTIGTTGTPASSTLILLRAGSATQVTLGKIERSLVNKNSVSTNIVYPSTIDAGLENVLSTTAPTTVNVNTANDFWVVITDQLSNSADTGILNDIQLYIEKP